ncbi:MAG: YCF48-related protein, partial [Ignavibacterium sp.]
MKNIFLLVLLIAIKSFSQTPAWFWSNPLPQGNDLNSISFVDQNNAFIFGNYGTMLKSGDGGNTWQFLQPFRPKKLSSVYFVNQNIGYGVGDNGLIIKTTNGGNSWITQTTNVDTNLSDIFFIDENYGYAVGDWGLV